MLKVGIACNSPIHARSNETHSNPKASWPGTKPGKFSVPNKSTHAEVMTPSAATMCLTPWGS
eukprot:4530096-Amphidinium_carterae.3